MSSVPTFNDASVDEQMQDLRSYFKGLGADISEENNLDCELIANMQEIISVCNICLRESSDSDVEASLNSIVSLLIMVPPNESEQIIQSFCEKLMRPPTSKMGHVCLRVLQNLYAAVGDHSISSYDVYFSLVKVAGTTDSIQTVFKDLEKLKTWLAEMKISMESRQRLLRALHDVLVDGKHSDLASKVMIELLGTYTEDNASQARDDAHRCIVASLGDPNTFLMDHLLALKPVRFLEGELIHDLLTIFVSEKLSAYMLFYAANKDFVHSLGLSHEQNLQKMRLLTFMQMAENQKEISYEIIEKELKIQSNEIEAFIIDVSEMCPIVFGKVSNFQISPKKERALNSETERYRKNVNYKVVKHQLIMLRTKLVRAKIDQLQKRVLVGSTMHRTFGKPQWQQLREILTRWRSNLNQVEGSLDEVIRAQYEPVPPIQS